MTADADAKPKVVFHMARSLDGTGLSYIGRQTATQLHQRGLLRRVTATSCVGNGLPPALVRTVPQTELLNRFLGLRGVRRIVRNRRLGYYLNDATFDWCAQTGIPPCDIFHGYPDESLFSARRARRQGALVVMDNVNAHPDHQAELMAAEHERFGVRLPAFHPRRYRRWRQALAEADHVLVLSTFAHQSFLDRGFPAEKLSIVPYGVDSALFRPRAKSDDVFRVLHMGQIGLRKGVQYLLEAWRRLALPDAEVLLVGWVGDNAVELLRKYEDDPSIRRMDHLTDMREIAAQYNQASVFVAASIEDGFAMTVTEAMASGLPVVVTENTGAKDMVRDGENGFVIPSHSAEAIAETLAALHRRRRELTEIGRTARRDVEALTWDRYGDRLAAVYARLLAGQDEE